MTNRRQRRALDASGKPSRQIFIGGTPYALKVLLITGRDALGRPRECRFVHEEETVDLQGGEEFVTVFAHAAAVGRHGS